MGRIWHFREFFHFYPILDYYKIRTRTNFENPKGRSLDLHLMMWFMLKELFQGSTDFTVGILKIPQISKHFSATLHVAHFHAPPKSIVFFLSSYALSLYHYLLKTATSTFKTTIRKNEALWRSLADFCQFTEHPITLITDVRFAQNFHFFNSSPSSLYLGVQSKIEGYFF